MARALWLADVLRAAGLTVREDAGWRTRGRDDFDPRGVIVHATAGGRGQSNDSAYNLLVNGRPGLSGPISQVMIERGTGVWRPVASGASNHAKTGTAGNCRGLGNRNLIGIEAHHDNLSEPWTETALDNYARGVAAICRKLGIGVNRVALHREHQPREKSDTTFDGNAFRARVARHLAGTGGDDMQADERSWLQNAYTATFFGGPSMGTPVPAKVNGGSTGNAIIDLLQHTRREVDALRAEVAELKVRPAGTVTVDAAAAGALGPVVEAAVRRVLGGLDNPAPAGQ